jgi:hypothetical protein
MLPSKAARLQEASNVFPAIDLGAAAAEFVIA